MSDDRMVHANITELRTDDATVANNAIEIVAEGNLRNDLIPVVMRLGMPFAIRGMTRQDRSAYRDNLVSMDQNMMATQRYAVWMANRELWLDHIAHPKRHARAACSCADPGLAP